MNHVDKMFRHKLEHHTVDVPEGAWDNIASRLPVQKNTRRQFLTYFGTVILLFVTLTTIYLSQTKDSINKKSELIESTSPVKTQKTLLASAMILKPTLDVISVKYDDRRNELIPTKKVPTKKEYGMPENSNITQNAGLTELSKSTFDHFGSNQFISTKSDENAVGAIKNINIQSIQMVDALHVESLNHNTSIINADKAVDNVHSGLFGKEKPVKACPFLINIKDKSVDVYYSNDYASRSLGLNDDKGQSYLNLRNNTEHAMYSFSAGVRFGYNIGYRWNLHTGINYSQINEKFKYIDPESNQTRLITIKDYIYQNGKIVDSIITEELVLVPGTSILKVYNKYKAFDIPVLARFTILANNKFSLSAIGGVYLNVGFSQKGMILGTDGITPADITSNELKESTVFKTQLGISLYSGVSLAYHLTPEVDFLLEPNARIQTESMTLGTYPIKQRYNTFGLSTGIRYKF
ncbi:MAG: outer membrane beta-barrel protein [Saprospiraceae bacterium]|nr:outer membrane beta-barrel protein [Saprospiraceae bacterium]